MPSATRPGSTARVQSRAAAGRIDSRPPVPGSGAVRKAGRPLRQWQRDAVAGVVGSGDEGDAGIGFIRREAHGAGQFEREARHRRQREA